MGTGDTPHGETRPLSQATVDGLRVGDSSAVFSLLVHERNGVTVVPLSPGVPVTVGRERPADIVVADSSLSRLHARFGLRDGVLSVEDLGSTNGTRVHGELVSRAELRPGEAVVLGRVLVSPHMRSSLEPALVGLGGHDALRSALDAALTAARFFGDGLAVLFVRALGRGETSHVSRWWRAVQAVLRPVDSMGLYSPHAVHLLLPRVDVEQAKASAAAVVRAAPRGCQLSCGVATFPLSATTVDALLDAASHAARGATASDAVRLSAEGVRAAPLEQSGATDVVLVSAAMRAVFEMVERLARVRLPVLLCGETGSGKEVVAHAIHDRGPRAGEKMVCVNCAAIPAQLVESTLFGHVRGAFTGADRDATGVFGAANGGTVLLDEVGELPQAAQAALLRALESGRVRRVGASEESDVDVRVIAATHRDLEAMCEAGTFRRDLLYRLDGARVQVPALRERHDDISVLANGFLRAAAARGDTVCTGIDGAALEALARYAWPGNVRELRNVIERAAVLADGNRVMLEDLPSVIAASAVGTEADRAHATAAAGGAADDPFAGGAGGLKERVQAFEAQLIQAALRRTGGNQTDAARLLDVPVRTLSDKIRRLGIDVDEARSNDLEPPEPTAPVE